METASAPAPAPASKPPAEAAAAAARKSTSMGALLAAMNQPKKKKAKEGGGLLIDKGLAELLKGGTDVAVDKDAVVAATKAAMAATGKMQVAEEVMFAGKSVAVFRSVDKGSDAAEAAKAAQAKAAQQSTLDRVVQELKHPKKAISAVEKSSYDWDKFKEDKGIAEEVERTAAQQSFVEKQAFLNRVDQRTFEVERAERDKARAHAAALAARAEKK